ncbi:vWA domain-containing protein [Coralloluteibacterium stylophorae]|uniref:VWA domain-containing protein n=1 Tax=Coralloluteibacterium stylophorae TaxID=1776034 RepID=A0A8J7VQE4_9GAMM|nr:VWA domain-containing protein [Coralloluteibacterium stylophorae]MBS7458083.1 VWA domain-containing protein [Coralloluteibacterium stylophorae]
MFLSLFHALRAERVPVTPREWLDLLAALDAGVAFAEPEALYALARTVLVKDERHYDRFDRAFGRYMKRVAEHADEIGTIPEDWLRQTLRRELSDEEKAKVQALGGLDELMKAFRERLAEQHERHAGGSKWIGTGGSSPFGAGGWHPEGIRVGPQGGGRSAVKVWDQRQFAGLDGDAELSPRNLKMALRRLRRFAREGAAEEFDLDGTVEATAREGGMLDIRMRPERHNAVSVLLLLDIGGSMDDHVHAAEALFGAARSEFKRLEHFYFHNFVYGFVWRDDRRVDANRIDTFELLRRYHPEHKVIFVGDAAMSPYEISHAGGSGEYWNEEAGATWFGRIRGHFRKVAWINPVPRGHWHYTKSTDMVRQLVDDHMYPLTPDGLAGAMRFLAR